MVDPTNRPKRQTSNENHQLTLQLFKQENGGEHPVISSDVLMYADDTFFDKYLGHVYRITDKVRKTISEGEKSSVIANINKEPLNRDFRREANSVIYNELRKVNDNDRELIPFKAEEKDLINAMVYNEIVGLGILEPLWQDSTITEIIANGPFDIQIEMQGTIHRVPAAKFRDAEHLESLIIRLYNSINKTFSSTNPGERARLHDNSRLFAVHRTVAPDGPNFNIRKHTEDYWSPADIIAQDTASVEMMTYLGNLINNGLSFLIIGGTGSGKALTHDTKIATPEGYTTIGEVKVGDKVFDRFGNVVKVTNKFPQPSRRVYKVIFENGAEIECDLEHNWYVSTVNSRKRNLELVDSKENRVPIYNDEKIAILKKAISKLDGTELATHADMYNELGFYIKRSEKPVVVSTKRKTLYNKLETYKDLIEYGQGNRNNQRYKSQEKYQVLTTEELIGNLRYQGKNNFQVPLLENPIEYKDGLSPDSLPIHPYLFGLWLGDGSSYRNKIASMKEDAIEYIKLLEEMGAKETLYQGKDHEYLDWRINSENFTLHLKDLGLMERIPGGNKFIPDLYLHSSIESRRLLLAGLIDSDGSASSGSRIWEFGNTSKRLIDGYVNIASSLGYKARLSPGKRKKFISSNGEEKLSKVFYTVTIATNDILGKLPRKVSVHQANKETEVYQDISIVDIVDTGRDEEMSCITVDGVDSTFIAGNHNIVTHNTTLLNSLTGFYADNIRIITLEENIEMKPHPRKLIAAAMEAVKKTPGSIGTAVKMRNLVEFSLQMRPDNIIIGEVTDASAYDLCQALNTGHAGASTVHANDIEAGMTRMMSLVSQSDLIKGRAALELIAAAFDFVIWIERDKETGERKIRQVAEITGKSVKSEITGDLIPQTKPLWELEERNDVDENGKLVRISKWHHVGNLEEATVRAHKLSLSSEKTWDELEELFSIRG